jgi:uncharacterized protein (DUF952 family)
LLKRILLVGRQMLGTKRRMKHVHKIVSESDWAAAVARGIFNGAGIDLDDGYIHLSTSVQVRETARLWFAGRRDLLLVSFDEASLGHDLKFEPSRGGDLFPHFFGVIDTSLARQVHALDIGADGLHVFPESIA